MTKVVAIIQARLGSTRLPGKVLMDVEGKTVLERVVERTRYAKEIDSVVVTMPTSERDDALAKFCEEKGIPFYRGKEEDLLGQYVAAAEKEHATHIVRITADCPLIDPAIIDKAIEGFFAGELDYLSTGRLVTTYPDGLDTEVFTKDALLRAALEAKLPSEHEHVTPYIWNHPELFRIATLEYERDLSALRWTVDEPRDLEFVRAIYHELAGRDVFPMHDVLGVLTKKPELGNINSDITRNSGYYKSLRQESGA